jgi:hypothetical protein
MCEQNKRLKSPFMGFRGVMPNPLWRAVSEVVKTVRRFFSAYQIILIKSEDFHHFSSHLVIFHHFL